MLRWCGLLEKPFQVGLIWGRGQGRECYSPIQNLEFSITNQRPKVVWSRIVKLIWSRNTRFLMYLGLPGTLVVPDHGVLGQLLGLQTMGICDVQPRSTATAVQGAF